MDAHIVRIVCVLVIIFPLVSGCPGNCSYHGTCRSDNTCECDPRWGESDCSFSWREFSYTPGYLAAQYTVAVAFTVALVGCILIYREYVRGLDYNAAAGCWHGIWLAMHSYQGVSVALLALCCVMRMMEYWVDPYGLKGLWDDKAQLVVFQVGLISLLVSASTLIFLWIDINIKVGDRSAALLRARVYATRAIVLYSVLSITFVMLSALVWGFLALLIYDVILALFIIYLTGNFVYFGHRIYRRLGVPFKPIESAPRSSSTASQKPAEGKGLLTLSVDSELDQKASRQSRSAMANTPSNASHSAGSPGTSPPDSGGSSPGVPPILDAIIEINGAATATTASTATTVSAVGTFVAGGASISNHSNNSKARTSSKAETVVYPAPDKETSASGGNNSSDSHWHSVARRLLVLMSGAMFLALATIAVVVLALVFGWREDPHTSLAHFVALRFIEFCMLCLILNAYSTSVRRKRNQRKAGKVRDRSHSNPPRPGAIVSQTARNRSDSADVAVAQPIELDTLELELEPSKSKSTKAKDRKPSQSIGRASMGRRSSNKAAEKESKDARDRRSSKSLSHVSNHGAGYDPRRSSMYSEEYIENDIATSKHVMTKVNEMFMAIDEHEIEVAKPSTRALAVAAAARTALPSRSGEAPASPGGSPQSPASPGGSPQSPATPSSPKVV